MVNKARIIDAIESMNNPKGCLKTDIFNILSPNWASADQAWRDSIERDLMELVGSKELVKQNN